MYNFLNKAFNVELFNQEPEMYPLILNIWFFEFRTSKNTRITLTRKYFHWDLERKDFFVFYFFLSSNNYIS